MGGFNLSNQRIPRQTRNIAGAAALAAGLLAGSANLAGATDLFLKFPGVTGDSTNNRHKAEIVLTSFSANATLNVANAGGGGGAGRAICGQVTVTKLIDRSSPQLIGLLFTGRATAGPVTITFEKALGEVGFDYYKVDLDNVRVQSIVQSDSEADIVKETVTLVANKFIYTYSNQAGDGSVTPIRFGWDCVRNVAII